MSHEGTLFVRQGNDETSSRETRQMNPGVPSAASALAVNCRRLTATVPVPCLQNFSLGLKSPLIQRPAEPAGSIAHPVMAPSPSFLSSDRHLIANLGGWIP